MPASMADRCIFVDHDQRLDESRHGSKDRYGNRIPELLVGPGVGDSDDGQIAFWIVLRIDNMQRIDFYRCFIIF